MVTNEPFTQTPSANNRLSNCAFSYELAATYPLKKSTTSPYHPQNEPEKMMMLKPTDTASYLRMESYY